MFKKVKRIRTKKKNCYFTETGKVPNYKDVLVLKRFLTDRQKVMHHNYSGLTEKNQRKLGREIKKARFMALISYNDKHMI